MVNLFKGMDKELNEIVFSEQIGLSEFFDRVEDGRIDPVLPYVCDDKNGEKVFAGDETNHGTVTWSEEEWAWVVIPDDDMGLGQMLYECASDIELIKDKDNG
jgi:hypothetical protein